MDQPLVRVSKLLSLVLRQDPQRIGLTLDRAGWVGVSECRPPLADRVPSGRGCGVKLAPT